MLMVAAVVNPLGAVRTGTLLLIEGTGAFGTASLALFRFAGGPSGTALVLAASVIFWLIVLAALALRRLRRADL